MRLSLEQISAVSGGNGGNSLEAVDFTPVNGLDGVFLGCSGGLWLVAVGGRFKAFGSEKDALYCIELLRVGKRLYEQGFDPDYIDEQLTKMMNQKTLNI